jgi:hypothetical protein
MQKRSSKDINNNLAALGVDSAAKKADSNRPLKKNPAAVALGRLGGQKGGPARAAALSQEKRHQIARKAAVTRWEKVRGQQSEQE